MAKFAYMNLPKLEHAKALVAGLAGYAEADVFHTPSGWYTVRFQNNRFARAVQIGFTQLYIRTTDGDYGLGFVPERGSRRVFPPRRAKQKPRKRRA